MVFLDARILVFRFTILRFHVLGETEGRGETSSYLLASVIRPLTTHLFRDGAGGGGGKGGYTLPRRRLN